MKDWRRYRKAIAAAVSGGIVTVVETKGAWLLAQGIAPETVQVIVLVCGILAVYLAPNETPPKPEIHPHSIRP